MSTAEALRSMRESVGYTQAELARRSGVARTVINAYEAGRREPSFKNVQVLAKACRMRVEIRPARTIDLERNGRILEQVLDLAELLPRRPRGALAYPPLRRAAES